MSENKKREGFNFYKSYFDVYKELDSKNKLQFIDSLLEREFYGIEPTGLKGMAKFAYISQQHSIDKQVKGWEDKTKCKLHPPSVGGLNPPCLQEEEKVQVQVQEEEKYVKLDFTEDVYKCYNSLINFFPEHLHPKNKNSWLDTIEKLNRIDKVPFEIIIDLVKKARNDNFWISQFLALPKLRKKNKDGIKYIVVFNEKFKIRTNQNNDAGNNLETLIGTKF